MRLIVAFATMVPLLAVPGGTKAETAPKPRLICEVVREWTSGPGREYPRDLEAIAKLPVRYRAAVLGSESRESQAALWRQQLRAFLVDASDANEFELQLQHSVPGGITPVVRAVLRHALASDIDYLHEPGVDPQVLNARLLEFDERLSHTLDFAVRRAIFGQLGSRIPGSIDPLVAIRWQIEEVETSALSVSCNCKQSLLFCGGGTSSVCTQSYPICEPETAGCGGLPGACDGVCRAIE